MKYSKPHLRSLNSESEMRCFSGSGASGSGCTEGDAISSICGPGTSNVSCYDGPSAIVCAMGSSPNFSSSRCYVGTGPS